MIRRIGFCLLTTVLVMAGLIAYGQQPAKVPRIGFLFIGSKDQPHLESFRRGLRDLDYIEGKNIVIEYRYAEGKSGAMSVLAKELVALDLDVILTTTASANRAVLQATSKIPVVTVGAGDPVLQGWANSLAEPGANLTGLSSSVGPGMEGKRLELLKDAVSKISVVALLWNPDAGLLADRARADAKAGGSALKLQVRPYEIKSAADLDRAFDGLKQIHANALMVTGGATMTRNSRRIAELGLKLRLPSMYQTMQFVEDGGLMAYGVSFSDLYRRAATYVDKILKGRKPADLPVEQPTKFELVINLKAAKQLGLTIPLWTLQKADRVIR